MNARERLELPIGMIKCYISTHYHYHTMVIAMMKVAMGVVALMLARLVEAVVTGRVVVAVVVMVVVLLLLVVVVASERVVMTWLGLTAVAAVVGTKTGNTL